MEPRPGLRVLAVTGGHRVDLAAFTAMLDGICAPRDWVWAHAEQPGAQAWLSAEHAGVWDVVLCHDLPGLHLRRGEEPRPLGPDPEVVTALIGLLERGQGVVALHHALAGWPAWPGWAEALGGRFLYRPGRLRGADRPVSGYCHTGFGVEIVADRHPVCHGLIPFELDDELYHAEVFDDVVTPLLRARADLAGSRFLCAHDVVRHGSSTGVTCAAQGPANDLLAWTTVAGRSPVAVIQPGDGPATFAHPQFRLLIANALAWAASPQARREAAAAPRTISPGLDPAVPSGSAART